MQDEKTAVRMISMRKNTRKTQEGCKHLAMVWQNNRFPEVLMLKILRVPTAKYHLTDNQDLPARRKN